MKRCSTCGEMKDESLFHFQSIKDNKRVSSCKDCSNRKQRRDRRENPEETKRRDKEAYNKSKERRVEYAREYRKKYKDRTRETNLKTKYGITQEVFNTMKESQDGCCAICGEHQDTLKRVLCIDHYHLTGKVRGLLCDTCNKFLGFYERLSKECAVYLQERSRCDCTYSILCKI